MIEPGSKLTHAVTVMGYVYKSGKFLLLKRNKPPLVWAPPGGRLKINEPPREGLKREILEETGFQVDVLEPVDIWFGELWPGVHILSIDFIVRITGGEFHLSPEHSDAKWVSLGELRRGEPISLTGEQGFRIEDFEKAHLKIKNSPSM